MYNSCFTDRKDSWYLIEKELSKGPGDINITIIPILRPKEGKICQFRKFKEAARVWIQKTRYLQRWYGGCEKDWTDAWQLSLKHRSCLLLRSGVGGKADCWFDERESVDRYRKKTKRLLKTGLKLDNYFVVILFWEKCIPGATWAVNYGSIKHL